MNVRDLERDRWCQGDVKHGNLFSHNFTMGLFALLFVSRKNTEGIMCYIRTGKKNSI